MSRTERFYKIDQLIKGAWCIGEFSKYWWIWRADECFNFL